MSTDYASDTTVSNSSEEEATSTSRRMDDGSFFNQSPTAIPPGQPQAPSGDKVTLAPSVCSSSVSTGEMLGAPSTSTKANDASGPTLVLPSKVLYQKNGARSAFVPKTSKTLETKASTVYAKPEGQPSFGNRSFMRFAANHMQNSALRTTANDALERSTSWDAIERDTRSIVEPGNGTSRPESRNSQSPDVQSYEGSYDSLFGSSPPSSSRQATPTKRSQKASVATQSSSEIAENTRAHESQHSVRGPIYAYDVPPSLFDFSLPGASTTYPSAASSRTSVSAGGQPSVKEEGPISGPSTKLTSDDDQVDEGGNADVSDGSYTPKAKSKASKKRKLRTSDEHKRAIWKVQNYRSTPPHKSPSYPHPRKPSFKVTGENSNSRLTPSPASEIGTQQGCPQQINNGPPVIRGDTVASEAALANGVQAPSESQYFEDGYDTFGLYDASDYGTNVRTAADRADAPLREETFRNTQPPTSSRNAGGTDQIDNASAAKPEPEPSLKFRKETVSIIIEDSRFPDREPSFVELDLPLRPNERGGFWLDAVALCKELQNGPWRIDGPAKAYVFRDKYRQYFLRVSEDNADNYAPMRLSVPVNLELKVMVEPQIEVISNHPVTRRKPRSGPTRPSKGSSANTDVTSTSVSILCPLSKASSINTCSTPSFS